jgi:FecR protein
MSHAPKLLALEAYAEARLSPRASAYLERHLSDCDVCRAALASVRAYARLRLEAREQNEDAHAELVPGASWQRLEALLDAAPKLAAHTQNKPRRRLGKWIALGWPVLAVAAALAIAWLGRLQPGVLPPTRVAQHTSSPRPATPRMIVGWVSLLAGQATLTQGASESAIALDTRVHEGDVLSTGADAQLHVQLGAATGFALAPNTRLRVATLRAGEIALELAAGRVANQVAKLEGPAQYQVRAGDLSASVRGTRFWVERSGEIAVFVHEGRVEVARGSELLASLTPGQGYPQQRFTNAQREAQAPVHFAPPDLDGTVGLILPPLPALRAFLIDGAALPVAGTLAMRLPPGPSELKFEDPRGQIRTVRVDLTAPLTTLEPAALAALLTPKPGPVGYLSPEQISSVVRTAIDPLRRCYERSLRFTPELESKFSLRIRVSAEGRVLRSEVDAREKLPIELERCIELEAQKLLFPKPEGAGPLSFEVPLNLKSR